MPDSIPTSAAQFHAWDTILSTQVTYIYLTPAAPDSVVYSDGLDSRNVHALMDLGMVVPYPTGLTGGRVVGLAHPDDVPAAPKGPGKVTVWDVKRFPRYYIAGDGRAAAEASQCSHGYRLTASCPNCP